MNDMPMTAQQLPVVYEMPLVALSFLVACVSAYMALSLGERLRNSSRGRVLWLTAGACVMGSGVWAMHFTGMLAYHLPILICYNVPTVSISLLAAIAASVVALQVVSQPCLDRLSWFRSGFAMGLGVSTMHYTGMAAMRLAARPQWDPRLVTLSIVIAIGVSLIAIRLVFALNTMSRRRTHWRRLGAAIVMGLAIAAMHYTGMAAAAFMTTPALAMTSSAVNAGTLNGAAIAVVTLLIMVAALAAAYLDSENSHMRELSARFGL